MKLAYHVCPKCKSSNVENDREINGQSKCLACGYKTKTSEFDVVEVNKFTTQEFDVPNKLPPQLEKLRDEQAGIYECDKQHPERKWDENDYKYRDFQAGFDFCYEAMTSQASADFDEQAAGFAGDKYRAHECRYTGGFSEIRDIFTQGARWMHIKCWAKIKEVERKRADESRKAYSKACELEREITNLKSEIAVAVEALQFYDGAHRQHWAIDLNKLSTVAFETLTKIKGEK